VSRHHCAIRVSPRRVFSFVDLGSTNGTWLAGFRIDSAYLKPARRSRGSMSCGSTGSDDEIREELSADDRFGDALGQSRRCAGSSRWPPRSAPRTSRSLLRRQTGTGKLLGRF